MDEIISGPPGANGGGNSGGGGAFVKDSDTANFAADVIEASRSAAVIVDFWAPWCGPCKQLGPILEKVTNEANGAIRLVKINIDENQQLAQQMRIQSIPAVYAFVDGQPVDGFVGAQPESQVREFAGRLVAGGAGGGGGAGVEEALGHAKAAMEAGDMATASAVFTEILAHAPDNAAAAAGLARCHVQSGELAQARELLDALTDEAAKTEEVAAVRAALDLAEQGAKAGPTDRIEAQLASNPNDHQARFDLAMARYAGGDREAAVDELLEIVARDREWNEQAAREQLLKLFEAFGPADPLTLSARRRLSSLLFS